VQGTDRRPGRPQLHRRLLAWIVGLGLSGLLIAATAATANADQAPTAAGPRSLAVSVPPDPVSFDSHDEATLRLRVSDPGGADVPVTFQQRGLVLGDNGIVNTTIDVDPRWADHVKLPQGEFVIPAQGYKEFDIGITKPPNLAPDVYLVGFVVTPRPAASGSVQAINQIGSFFTVDIPGPRDWRLKATVDLPSFKLGGSVAGFVTVHNIGRSSLRFWGDVTERFFPFGQPKQQRIEKLFLPAGHSRGVHVSASPQWGIGIVTVPVRISYPSGTNGATSVEVLVEKKVFVVHPLWAVAAALLFLLFVWRMIRRYRRRRPVKEPKPAKAPKSAKTPKPKKAPKVDHPDRPRGPQPAEAPEAPTIGTKTPEPAAPQPASPPPVIGADGSPNLLPTKKR